MKDVIEIDAVEEFSHLFTVKVRHANEMKIRLLVANFLIKLSGYIGKFDVEISEGQPHNKQIQRSAKSTRR